MNATQIGRYAHPTDGNTIWTIHKLAVPGYSGHFSAWVGEINATGQLVLNGAEQIARNGHSRKLRDSMAMSVMGAAALAIGRYKCAESALARSEHDRLYWNTIPAGTDTSAWTATLR